MRIWWAAEADLTVLAMWMGGHLQDGCPYFQHVNGVIMLLMIYLIYNVGFISPDIHAEITCSALWYWCINFVLCNEMRWPVVSYDYINTCLFILPMPSFIFWYLVFPSSYPTIYFFPSIFACIKHQKVHVYLADSLVHQLRQVAF